MQVEGTAHQSLLSENARVLAWDLPGVAQICRRKSVGRRPKRIPVGFTVPRCLWSTWLQRPDRWHPSCTEAAKAALSPSGAERGKGSSAGAYSISWKTREFREGFLPACGQWGQPLACTPFPSPAAKSVCVWFLLSLASFCKQSKSRCRSKAGNFLVTDQRRHMIYASSPK